MSFFFGFKGQIGRAKYWLLLLFWAVAIVSTGPFLIKLVDQESTTLQSVILFALFALISISIMSIVVRRLHDLGKSGWWYVLYILVPKTGIAFSGADPGTDTQTAVLAVCGIIALWAFLDLGFVRGKMGDNKYAFASDVISVHP